MLGLDPALFRRSLAEFGEAWRSLADLEAWVVANHWLTTGWADQLTASEDPHRYMGHDVDLVNQNREKNVNTSALHF